MSLSCSCGSEDYEWFYSLSDDVYSANSTGECYGCWRDIHVGEEVRHILSSEMDENGDETNWSNLGRICEQCSDMYDNLTELGFCLEADNGFIETAYREYLDEFVSPRNRFGVRALLK